MSPAEAAGQGGRPRRGKGGSAAPGAKGDGSAPPAKGEKPEPPAKGDKSQRPAKGDESPSSPKVAKSQRPAKGRPARKRPNPLGRLRTGEAIYLLAAILLFVLMFLDWYGVKGANSAEPLGGVVTSAAGGDAWQTLEVIPLFLMLAIVVAVGSALLRLTSSDWKPAIPPAAAVCVLGGLAALLIFIRIVSPPGPGDVLEGAFDTTLKLPVFLALAAALGIAYGGWRAMRDEGTSFADVGKRLEAPSPPAKKPKAAPSPATASKKPASPHRPTRKKP